MNINKVVFAGRIGQIKSSSTQDGMYIVNLRVASTKRYKDKSGAQQEKTTWISAVAFNRQAEVISQYFQKGDPIYLEGNLDVRNWEDNQGQKRESIEIRISEFQFVGSKSNSDFQGSQSYQSNQPNQSQSNSHDASAQHRTADTGWEDDQDQIPF